MLKSTVLCFLFLSLGQHAAAQGPPFSVAGSVKLADSSRKAVSRAVVGISQSGREDTTKDNGDFILTKLPPIFQPGVPATFYVNDWIIDSPYVAERGRTYLPRPDVEFITILVRKEGDRAFLSGPSVEQMLGQRVFFFGEVHPDESTRVREPKLQDAVLIAGGSSSLYPRRDRTTVPGGEAFSIGPPQLELVSQSSQQQASNRDWDAFLAKQAKEIGFTVEELRGAIQLWSRDVQTQYQKGLLALYNEDYDAAAHNFSAALESRTLSDELKYGSVAYAEFKLGNYPESASFLGKLIALHPQDPLFQQNLQIVQQKQGQQKSQMFNPQPGRNVTPPPPCVVTQLTNVGGVEKAWAVDGGGVAAFAGMKINLDGYSRAYNAKDYEGGALRHLCEAGKVYLPDGTVYKGSIDDVTCTGRFMEDYKHIGEAGWRDPAVGAINWSGILGEGTATIDRKTVLNVKPVLQKGGSGFYVSPTALADTSVKDLADQSRYINPLRVPFAVVPGNLASRGITMGTFGVAMDRQKGIPVPFVVGDLGLTIGEGSAALGRKVAAMPIKDQLTPDDRNAGQVDTPDVLWVFFARDSTKYDHTREDSLTSAAGTAYVQWGGDARLCTCMKAMGGECPSSLLPPGPPSNIQASPF